MASRVLILEDDPFIALDLQSMLEDEGYDVMGPVASARQALDLIARDGKPDCALLDFFVSGGTTVDVAREFETRGVPFMFLTGNSRDAKTAIQRDALCNKTRVRTKPFLQNRIMDDVSEMLG